MLMKSGILLGEVGVVAVGVMVVAAVLLIAFAKIPERDGSISQSSFYGQVPDYYTFFSLIYPVGEFSLNEIRVWGESQISSDWFCAWCELTELESRGSSRFPCVTPVVETFSDRVTFRIPSNINDGTPLRKQPKGSTS